jgi:hydrogenase maturation protein HypF
VEPLRMQALPRAVPARVLACGAFLKSTACLLDGRQVHWSPLHDDLSTPEACVALEASLDALVAAAPGPIDAVAHDLHPDFHSTRVARRWAERLRVPAIEVQHHHAHVGVVQAEQGWHDGALIGLALDGVGLGTDGTAWGGELLRVRGGAFERMAHLPLLALPGGDVAAREPWRMAAAVLHALGRGDEIVPRFAPIVGASLARGVQAMLARGLNCPRTSSTGRWFDAAAGALGLSVRQRGEAEAAIALEQAAASWLATQPHQPPSPATLDLLPLLGSLFDEPDAARGAARFHAALAAALVAVATDAAHAAQTEQVALAGGCFFNRVLAQQMTDGLRSEGLQPVRPQHTSCGDAGLALGQAWVAALQLAGQRLRACEPALEA